MFQIVSMTLVKGSNYSLNFHKAYLIPSRHSALKQRCINVDATSRRHIEVDTTSSRRYVRTKLPIHGNTPLFLYVMTRMN